MFIQISSWHSTNFHDSPEQRFSEALSESAVAITITSVTDIVAFAIGTWNPLPAVQMFCYYTAVAMFFELMYQCSFYSAALYLLGKFECQGRHCISFQEVKPIEEQAKSNLLSQWLCLGTVMKQQRPTNKFPIAAIEMEQNGAGPAPHPDHFEHRQNADHELSIVQDFFRNKFGPVLLHPVSKVFVAFLFAGYLAMSIYGSINLPNGLQPEKLVPKTHYVYKFLLTDHYWDTGVHMQILLNNPPDVNVYENRVKLRAMVEKFENTEHTCNGNFTMFWMREYETYFLNQDNNWEDSPLVTSFQPKSIKDWLKSTGSYAYWRSCIEWGNATLKEDPNKMKAFRFAVALRNYGVPIQQQDAVVLVRNLLSEFPEYNMTCFEQHSPFIDQYLMVYPVTIRNTLMSLGVMIIIAFLLIPHPICGIFMTLSVLSIDVGVSGFLYWWDVGMDCISMITMIMATGFAVDLSAHVSYAYIRAEGTANERAVKALETLGWPVFQGVTATFLGVLVMGCVEAYMFVVFFKTVVLVILIGLFHSIVFLPVTLTVFVPKKLDTCRRKRKIGDNSAVEPL